MCALKLKEKLNKEDILQILLSEKCRICRFCLEDMRESQTQEQIPIFNKDLVDSLHSCNIKLMQRKDLHLPEFICQKCYSALKASLKFLKMIRQSERLLEKLSSKLVNGPDNDNSPEITYLEFKIEEKVDDKKYDNLSSELHNHEECDNTKTAKKVASINNKNRGDSRETLKERMHKCSHCQKEYKSNYELKIHTRSHTGEKPFNCLTCGKLFGDSRNLKRHEKVHSGNKQHVCKICEKKFLHLFSLNTHKRIHTGEKRYVCESCGKSFNTSGELRIHFRIHSNDRPYSCGFCAKTFSSKTALNVHVYTHTGEKRYECPLCSRKCRAAYDLKVHMRCHNNEKPYRCKYANCLKSYRNNSQLNVHLRTHTGQKVHQCPVCMKRFGESNTLNRHMKTHTKADTGLKGTT